MHDPLDPLLADGVIDEVISRLKSGKEADLWLVRHGQEVVAAKVYKERQARSFKNNAAYREGRRIRNSRTQRAIDKGSRFGQAAAEEAWKTREADALHALHAAGVRVPRPVLFYEGVLLMEVVVNAAGHPAPRLIDAQVTREQAAGMYADLRAQVVRMLCCDLVHGDLSPYNVLLGWNGPVIIDFPQVVGAAHNNQAEGFFFRDLANLRHHFEAIDPALRAMAGDGREIWRAYTRRELTPDFAPPPPRPGAPPPADRPRPPPRQEQQRQEPQRPRGNGHQRQQGQQGSPPHQARRPEPRQHPGAQRSQAPQRSGQARPAPAPIVERKPVLGGPTPLATQAASAPTPPHAAGAPPGARPGRRRRRRRGRGRPPGGSAPTPV